MADDRRQDAAARQSLRANGGAGTREAAPTTVDLPGHAAAAQVDRTALRQRLIARIDNLRRDRDNARTPGRPAGPGIGTRAANRLAASGRSAVAAAQQAAVAGTQFAASRVAPALLAGGRAAAQGGRRGAHAAATAARSGIVSAAVFTRERALPWIARTARFLRERLRQPELKRDYAHILLLVHTHAFDRDVESVLFAPARQPLPLARPHHETDTGHADTAGRPTPRRVFQWAMAAIPQPVNRFAFVDLGAGRGRTLLLATAYDFEKAIGVEPDPDLHNDCQMNIAQYPRSRMKCREVECVLGALEDLDIPAQEIVFHLFGPAPEDSLSRLMARISASYAKAPRRMYCICVGRQSAAAMARQPNFAPLPIEGRLKRKIDWLSPYKVALFRSLA